MGIACPQLSPHSRRGRKVRGVQTKEDIYNRVQTTKYKRLSPFSNPKSEKEGGWRHAPENCCFNKYRKPAFLAQLCCARVFLVNFCSISVSGSIERFHLVDPERRNIAVQKFVWKYPIFRFSTIPIEISLNFGMPFTTVHQQSWSIFSIRLL